MFRMTVRLDGGRGLEIDRLNFLTDGIYAIVMTLLVLELKIPEGLAPDRILPALIESAPNSPRSSSRSAQRRSAGAMPISRTASCGGAISRT